jgi:GT2 family glycosyltransferase
VIIVDDGSSDDSHAVGAACAELRPERITAIRLEHNVGIGGARNAAIAASRGGELIVLLDSDDYLRSDYVEHLVGLCDEARTAGRSVGILACNGYIHTSAGVTGETFADRYWWSDAIDYGAMLERNYVFARAMFSRAAYDAVGGFSPECLGYDDYDLWLRILESGFDVATTREPLAYYRVHDSAASADHRFMSQGGMVALRRILERGAVTPRQRRKVQARVRHYRALHARARFLAAARARRFPEAARRALEAAPLGAVAFLQDPSRWREWGGDLRRGVERRVGAARRPRTS